MPTVPIHPTREAIIHQGRQDRRDRVHALANTILRSLDWSGCGLVGVSDQVVQLATEIDRKINNHIWNDPEDPCTQP